MSAALDTIVITEKTEHEVSALLYGLPVQQKGAEPMTTHVLIVDDSIQSRFYMKSVIAGLDRYNISQELESAESAELCCEISEINLVLMDVCTADDASGLIAAEHIKKRYPDIKVIIVTSMPEHSFIQKAKQAGCEGFWYKENEPHELLNVMDRVMQGEIVYPEHTPKIKIGYAQSTAFTERELEVIKLKVKGYTYAEIAGKLNISESTVKYHLQQMLNRTGFESPGQLAYELLSKKIILPDY